MERYGGGGGRSSSRGSCHHHHRHQPPWKRRSSDVIIQSLSWPPRSYSCSFCKREFRSAQALGGHMNVHRRDRAMLRNYSPPLLPSSWDPPNPNPTPARIPNLNFSPPPPSATSEPKLHDNSSISAAVIEFVGIAMKSTVMVEEDLDLELRLGYA